MASINLSQAARATHSAYHLHGAPSTPPRSERSDGQPVDATTRVPQLRRRLVTRNRPLNSADTMITGGEPRHPAHRLFPGARPCRSASYCASQTAHRGGPRDLRRRDLCPKVTSEPSRTRRTGRHVCPGQHACSGRPLPHVTTRYGGSPREVNLWTTSSVTRPIHTFRPRVTAPVPVTWADPSRPSPETSRAAEPEHDPRWPSERASRQPHPGWSGACPRTLQGRVSRTVKGVR